MVSHETIRQWCAKFGQSYANQLRRRRPRPGDKWHLDEVVIPMNGERMYLWRAVDQDGVAFDIPVGVFNIASALPQTSAPVIGAGLLAIGGAGAENYTALLIVAAAVALIGAAVIVPIKGVR